MKKLFNKLKNIFKSKKDYFFLIKTNKLGLNEYLFFQTKNENIKKKYYNFLLEEAIKMKIEINKHYYNIMNYEFHINYDYDMNTYFTKKEKWENFLKKYDFVWFIKNKCQVKELNIKKIYN